jgi:hypothetical protein
MLAKEKNINISPKNKKFYRHKIKNIFSATRP